MAHVPTAAVIGGSVAVGSIVVPGISVVSIVVVVLAVAAEATVGAVIVTLDASVLVFDPKNCSPRYSVYILTPKIIFHSDFCFSYNLQT